MDAGQSIPARKPRFAVTDRDLMWERWQDVDRLLAAALELPADERAAYVRQAAGHDTRLQALLLRLLDRLAVEGS
jgi:hypothetical protein